MDIFSSFFGGGGFSPFGGGGGRRGPQRTKDMVQPLNVKLEDIYNGKTRKMKVTRNIICVQCSGTGSKDGKGATKCGECDGNGIKVMLKQFGPGMFQQIRTHCPGCDGRGEIIASGKRCAGCNGKKTTKESKILNVEIDKGVHEGKKIIFSGESDQEPGLETGDIVFVIQEEGHPVFKRSGDDLIIERDINLIDALIGFSFKFEHLDARTVIVESKKGDIVKPDDIKEIPGLGMPLYGRPYQHGNLYIKFNVIFPANLTNDQMNGLKTIFTPTPEPTSEGEKFVAQKFDQERYKERKHEQQHRQQDHDEEDGEREGIRTNCTSQ